MPHFNRLGGDMDEANAECAQWDQDIADRKEEKDMSDKFQAKLATFPEEVRQFVTAMVKNAMTVEGWETRDMEGGQCFAETIPYISRKEDGSVEVCDNYERFFDMVYTYSVDGVWSVRWMYADRSPKAYTFAQCMSDASIMFTG